MAVQFERTSKSTLMQSTLSAKPIAAASATASAATASSPCVTESLAPLIRDSFELVELPLLVAHLQNQQPDCVQANQTFLTFTGCTNDELNAGGLLAIPVTDVDSQRGLSKLRAAIVAGEAHSEELNLRLQNSHNARVTAKVKPLPGSSTDCARALLVLRPHKPAQQDASSFLSTVAHELQTPLTSVKGYAALLTKRPFDTVRQLRIAGLIERQTDRLSRLVAELMSLSQMDSRGTLGLKHGPVDLLTLMSDALDAIGPERNERIQVALPPDPLPTLWGDQDRLVQMLVNVLDNALKYSTEDSPVFLNVETSISEADRHTLLISVRDHSPGLAPEDLARVFERFYRSPQHEQIPGTGLGLPLVKAIVELHGGTVTIQSTPSQGSQIDIHLPLTSEAG